MRQIDILTGYLADEQEVYDLGFIFSDLNIEKLEGVLEISEPTFEGVKCYGVVYDSLDAAEEDTGADESEVDYVYKFTRLDSKGELHTTYEHCDYTADSLERFKEVVKEAIVVAPELKEINIEEIYDNKDEILENIKGWFKERLENELPLNEIKQIKKSKI